MSRAAAARTSFWRSSPNRVPQRITLAIDLEWYDQSNGNHVKEVGLAIEADDDPDTTLVFHYIVSEHQHLKNRYCPTSRLGFVFGRSQVLPLAQVVSEVQYWFDGAGYPNTTLDIVGHGFKQDFVVLDKMRVHVPARAERFDTGLMYKFYSQSRQTIKLERLLEELHVGYDRGAFHNAGNDARYTLDAYAAMLGFFDFAAFKVGENQ